MRNNCLKITELENQSKALEEEYYEKQRLLKSEEEKSLQYDLLTSLKIKMPLAGKKSLSS